MTKNLDKEGLSSIVDNYQLFYVDLWGVIHNGVSLHMEAIRALKEIAKKKKDELERAAALAKTPPTPQPLLPPTTAAAEEKRGAR